MNKIGSNLKPNLEIGIQNMIYLIALNLLVQLSQIRSYGVQSWYSQELFESYPFEQWFLPVWPLSQK